MTEDGIHRPFNRKYNTCMSREEGYSNFQGGLNSLQLCWTKVSQTGATG